MEQMEISTLMVWVDFKTMLITNHVIFFLSDTLNSKVYKETFAIVLLYLHQISKENQLI